MMNLLPIPFSERYGCIYKITNTLNYNSYIGQTITSGIRFLKYYGSGYLVKKAINKHGINVLKKEVLDFADSKHELDEKEKLYVKLYKPEYNMSEGGQGGIIYEVNPMKGKKRTQEFKDYLSKKFSGSNGFFYGRKHTEENKRKARERASGENNPRFVHFSKSEINLIIQMRLNKKALTEIVDKFNNKFSVSVIKRVLKDNNIKVKITSKGKKRGPMSVEARLKMGKHRIGKKHSEETKRKIAESKFGDKNPSKRKDVREKISLANKGKKRSEEVRKKLSIIQTRRWRRAA